jgi:hypothetical protein
MDVVTIFKIPWTVKDILWKSFVVVFRCFPKYYGPVLAIPTHSALTSNILKTLRKYFRFNLKCSVWS